MYVVWWAGVCANDEKYDDMLYVGTSQALAGLNSAGSLVDISQP
jgi:hypothetical protein